MCTLDRNPGHTFHINGFIYSVGEARVFLVIAGGGGINREGWELCSPALQSKERLLTFSTPRVKRTYGVILRIFQTKIAVRLSIVIAREL